MVALLTENRTWKEDILRSSWVLDFLNFRFLREMGSNSNCIATSLKLNKDIRGKNIHL